MDATALRRAGVAVLGLDTTTGRPPLITEVAVIYLDDGLISSGPFAYWVAPDAPMFQVRHESWSEVRLAPPWPQVAEQVRLALCDRVLVTHDAGRLDVLRSHLPDWEPVGVAHTRDLAEQTWPGLPDYTLGPAVAHAGIKDLPRVGPSAVVEAHAVALLLAALLRQSTQATSAR
jgi:DNA polymerase III epsilon subunit-like protein